MISVFRLLGYYDITYNLLVIFDFARFSGFGNPENFQDQQMCLTAGPKSFVRDFCFNKKLFGKIQPTLKKNTHTKNSVK